VFEETPNARRAQQEKRVGGMESAAVQATRKSLAMAPAATRSGDVRISPPANVDIRPLAGNF
jgi:hypothetical protein